MTASRGISGGILLLLAVGWLAIAPRASAGQDGAAFRIEAPAASALIGAGELVLVDVRGASEWAKSGVPRGAEEISLFPSPGITNENFIDQVLAAVGGDKSTPIAAICATGMRSSLALKILKQNGFTAVYSVAEGMLGSKFGPGWLRRGLPVEPCQTC
jgi:rhodanese-related sulfurtransferase